MCPVVSSDHLADGRIVSIRETAGSYRQAADDAAAADDRTTVSGAVEDATWHRQPPRPRQRVVVSDGRDARDDQRRGRGRQGRATPQGSESRGLEYGGAPWDAATGHGRQGPRRR